VSAFRRADLRFVSTKDNAGSAEAGHYSGPSSGSQQEQRRHDIIEWTLERSGILARPGLSSDFYYQTAAPAIKSDGDVFKVLDVLVFDVGIRGIFSDWAATVTYFANCMGLK